MRSAVVLLGFALASAGARAESYAVCAVDADAAAGGAPARAATSVRDLLAKQGYTVLSVAETRARLAQPRGVTGYDLAPLQKRLDSAEAANAALDPQRSVKILESVVEDLARDPDFTRDKQQLLEDARVRLAARLLAIAGARETGEAETPEGLRASAVLLDALRTNPTLSLDQARFPPKMHRLMSRATEGHKRLGLGALSVTSKPAGASVFLEGREVGSTPLMLNNVIAQGTYRIWGEYRGVRSVTQKIEVTATTPELFIDLSFEGALWPDGPGLKPLAQTTIDEEVAKKVGRFMAVDQLLLVGVARYDDGDWLYGVAFSVASSSSSRRGAVKLEEGTDLEKGASLLADFLRTGAAPPELSGERVPTQVLPQTPVAARSDGAAGSPLVLQGGEPAQPPSVEGGFPWMVVGIGTAVGGALLLAGGIIAAVAVVNAPRDGTATVAVEVIQ